MSTTPTTSTTPAARFEARPAPPAVGGAIAQDGQVSASAANGRRRWLRGAGRGTAVAAFAATLPAGLWLGGCTSVGVPGSVVVPRERIDAWVAGRFPIVRGLGGLAELRVGVPTVTLRPDSNRIAMLFDVSASSPYLAGVRGTLGLDHRVRYEPDDGTVRIAGVHVDRLQIDRAPAFIQRQLDGVGTRIAEQALEGQALYTLSDGDRRRLRAAGVQPGDIRVTESGIEIGLVPLTRV